MYDQTSTHSKFIEKSRQVPLPDPLFIVDVSKVERFPSLAPPIQDGPLLAQLVLTAQA